VVDCRADPAIDLLSRSSLQTRTLSRSMVAWKEARAASTSKAVVDKFNPIVDPQN